MKKLILLLGIFIFISCTNEKKYQVAQINTIKGEMLFWLSDKTPVHKASFIKLANENYWDSLTFNRVIKDFVIQGGCPDTREGFSDSPYLLQPEFNDSLKHVYGALGAGRDGNPEKLSAGCQFYIVHAKDGLARLDNNYTIFGQIFKGIDVMEAIANVETNERDSPLEEILLDINIISLTETELLDNGYDLNK